MSLKYCCFGAIVSFLISASPSWAQSNPLVFDSHAKLRKIGVELEGWGPNGGQELPEKCGAHFGGDGMYDFTFSRQFVDKFRKRGFTNLSLCMAMASGIKYHPETGARLRTFILADVRAIRRRQIEAGTATDEIPIDVPDCFRNAQPLADCKLNFDMTTGDRLTRKQSRELKQARAGDDDSPIAVEIEDRHLPRGRGYVLYNEGPAGPEPSNDTIKIVLRNANR